MKRDQKTHWPVLFHVVVFTLLASNLNLFQPNTARAGSMGQDEKQDSQSVTGPLKAEDKDGIPVPDNYTDYSGEQTQYLHSVDVSSPSPLKTVAEFYRSELTSKKWNALPDSAGAAGNKTTLMFENSKKERLVVRLSRNDSGGTTIHAFVKSEGAARNDGILPPVGQTRIYLGNATDAQVTFSIDQKKITVKKESINDKSMKNAPFLDVKPGKYPFTLSITGQSTFKDSVNVGPDETWALIAGPGGAMPIQIY